MTDTEAHPLERVGFLTPKRVTMAKTADSYLSAVKAEMGRAASDRQLPGAEYRRFLEEIEGDASAALSALEDDPDPDDKDADE